MKIALVQTKLIWEDSEANRNSISKMLADAGEFDLAILPEMFTTGFSMIPDPIAETMSGATISWMKEQASYHQAAICGSVIITENRKFYNRFLFVFPSGEVRHYDKRHLFSLAGEDEMYTRGNRRIIIEYQSLRICPLVCYDLRFPVFSRNTEDFDLMIYAANWPEPRINAWDILLKARAVENMCFVAGVNRIGEDQAGLKYNGHSQMVNYLGMSVIEPSEKEGVFICEIKKGSMLETRAKLPFLNDRDTFEIIYP